MDIIAKHSSGKVLKRDALQIAAEAKSAKALDPTVINATIGTFFYEDGSFRAFKTVKDLLSEFPDDKFYTYSPSNGGADFQEAALNWVLDNNRSFIESKMSARAVATPGGTGALYNSIFNSLDPGETLLIPSLYWGPYVGMASNLGYNVEKFEMFHNEQFNIEGLIEKAEEIIEKQKKLVLVINDPCNNPTGYTMTQRELKEVIDFLNSKIDIPCVLIYDIAYLDFAYEGRKQTREKFPIFTKANSNIIIIIAFSASKTFAVYGLRLGAQIILGKDQHSIKEYYDAGNFTARNTWSNCNKSLISMLISFDKNPELKKRFLFELDEVVGIQKKRSDLFLKEAREVGLVTHPYRSGFFVTIPVDNNELVLEKLIEKEKLYLLPFEQSVRLALCALPLKNIEGLALKIKRVIDSI